MGLSRRCRTAAARGGGARARWDPSGRHASAETVYRFRIACTEVSSQRPRSARLRAAAGAGGSQRGGGDGLGTD